VATAAVALQLARANQSKTDVSEGTKEGDKDVSEAMQKDIEELGSTEIKFVVKHASRYSETGYNEHLHAKTYGNKNDKLYRVIDCFYDCVRAEFDCKKPFANNPLEIAMHIKMYEQAASRVEERVGGSYTTILSDDKAFVGCRVFCPTAERNKSTSTHFGCCAY
jgi:hypothetical protein